MMLGGVASTGKKCLQFSFLGSWLPADDYCMVLKENVIQ
uniref:Putative LOC100197594 [Hydra vulgaris] n=1 Tax=Lepeophtheirus salmonis TaxID=72036 RepID=A0A0K2THL2_LEPSM